MILNDDKSTRKINIMLEIRLHYRIYNKGCEWVSCSTKDNFIIIIFTPEQII